MRVVVEDPRGGRAWVQPVRVPRVICRTCRRRATGLTRHVSVTLNTTLWQSFTACVGGGGMAFSCARGGLSLEGLRVMIDGASEVNPVMPGPVVPARVLGAHPRGAVPVILRATEAEATGAQMHVGGLRIVDRAIRQLGRLRDAHVVIATDGSIRLPRRLPKNIERREISGDVETAVTALEAALGQETTIVGADTVWLVAGRFDKGIESGCGVAPRRRRRRVQRPATRRHRDRRPAAQPEDRDRADARVAGEPADLAGAADAGRGFAGVYGALLIATGTSPNVMLGFAALQGYVILEACAGALSRLRLHQSALAAWLETVVGDFVAVVSVLAVGARAVGTRRQLPRHEDGARGRRDAAAVRGDHVPGADPAGRGGHHQAALVVHLRPDAALGQRIGQPDDQRR